MPITVSETFIHSGLNDGTIYVLDNEPYMIIKDEEDILPKHKAIRDKAYCVFRLHPDTHSGNIRTA